MKVHCKVAIFLVQVAAANLTKNHYESAYIELIEGHFLYFTYANIRTNYIEYKSLSTSLHGVYTIHTFI